MNNKNILNWLEHKYDDKNTILDYCYNLYQVILDYCTKNDLEVTIPQHVFIGHLASVLYDTHHI